MAPRNFVGSVGSDSKMLDSKQKVLIWLYQSHHHNVLPQSGGTPNISNQWLTLNIVNNYNINCYGLSNDVKRIDCLKLCDAIKFKPPAEFQCDKVPINSGRKDSAGMKEFRVDIGQNGYNSLNHDIHQCLWCPCLLYFVFIFCLPAVYCMHKSDKSFHKNDTKKSRVFAIAATLSYMIGFLLTTMFYAAIGWIMYNRL